MATAFKKVAKPNQASSFITERLKTVLRTHQRVLWIVTGGSNIPLIVTIMKAIPKTASKKLAIMLSDERFEPIGHPDSNLQQLYIAGFDPKLATVVPILRPGVPLETTVHLYAEAAAIAFRAADYCFGYLGIGADGHVAGILPGSPATKKTTSWTAAYETPEFMRLTLTPFALSHLSEVVVVAFGASKRPTLEQLKSKRLSVNKQPAQLLKRTPLFTVLSDQVGE